MLNPNYIIARDDDIFLTCSPTTGKLLYNFDAFVDTCELIWQFKFVIHRIGIIASEIYNYPLLKEFIFNNKNRLELCLHGWAHDKYHTWQTKEIINILDLAKKQIENIFEVNVKTYIPPWNKVSAQVIEACDELSLKIDQSPAILYHQNPKLCKHVHFHYWNPLEVAAIKTWMHNLSFGQVQK